MSTQQILGVVGGVVGAFFGYPQLGFVVGSLVGGLLTPGEKTEGPRVDDLKVQVSTYGAGLPIVYGTERVGGNVVWSTDKIEVEETTGGKGGEPENTSYRYYVHMGVVLCDTPRDGSTVSIVQIFKDGKLIYDARAGIPIGSALASSENPHAYFVMYQGHSDQLPDSGEEAWMGGPGSVPAYRGVVRIRMNAIECPGGRVPQFSFVLSTSASTVSTVETFADVDNDAAFDAYVYGVCRQTEAWHFETLGNWYDSAFAARVTYCGPGYTTHQRDIPLPIAGGVAGLIPLSGDGDAAAVYPYNGNLMRVELTSGVLSEAFIFDSTVPAYWHGQSSNRSASYDAVTDRYVLHAGDSTSPNNIWVISMGRVLLGGAIPGTPGAVAIKAEVAYALSQSAGKLVISRYQSEGGVFIDSSTTGPVYTDASSSITYSALHPSSDGELFAWARNADTGTHNLWLISFATGSAVWTLINDDVRTADQEKNSNTPTVIYADQNMALIGPSSKNVVAGTHNYAVCRHATILTNAVKVSDIIADQCDRAGETRYDVSAIPDTDTLIGYKLQNPASARANIDPLLTAFAIYIVDEDGLIKFKKYEDIVSEATVTYDELGQAEDGSEPADAMPLNRAQEVDMPRSVSVSYIEPTFDYQTATEKEVRQITEATEDLIVELPMCTTSDHAKRVASMILFAKWRGQNTRSFKTSRKFAFLSPGDGVTVEYPRGTFRLWRITSMTDTGALCEFNVEPGDAELYTQTAVGATGYVQQEVSPIVPPTRLQLLDIPILRDVDNNAGLYAALDGFGPGWSGAELFSGDDDANLASRGTVSSDAPIGVAETALASASSAFVDETNLITVSIGDDTFENSTRDVLLAGGAEYWALGAPGRWEIGASAQGDDLGDGRYILSRHLRGQFGTEQYVGTHEVGDTFVLLRIAGMLRPNMGVGDIGQDKRYRAVSKGRSFQSVSSQTYANTGEGLMPLSPVNLRRTDTNDLTVDRRSRLAMNNSTGTLPLGETTEAYSWSFYTSGAFTTLIGTALTTTAAITSAQITTAGATPSGTLYVEVRQISDSVGAGHELQATV